MLNQHPDLFSLCVCVCVCVEIQEAPEFLLLKSFLERSLGWEGGSQGRGYMYTYNSFMMLYSRKEHNIVNNYSPIKKNKVKKQ